MPWRHKGGRDSGDLYSTLSLTSAVDRGGWSTPHPRRFIPCKETQCKITWSRGGSRGRSIRALKISSQPGFNSRTVQPVTSHYTDWAILAAKHFPFLALNRKIFFVSTLRLVPVAARSNAWVCGNSPAEIMGSNPTGDMDVCLLWVLGVVR